MNLFRLCVANLVALFWVVIPTAMGANIIPQPCLLYTSPSPRDS